MKCSGFARKYINKKKRIRTLANSEIAKIAARQRKHKCAKRGRKYRAARKASGVSRSSSSAPRRRRGLQIGSDGTTGGGTHTRF